jgi:hypothetical protein
MPSRNAAATDQEASSPPPAEEKTILLPNRMKTPLPLPAAANELQSRSWGRFSGPSRKIFFAGHPAIGTGEHPDSLAAPAKKRDLSVYGESCKIQQKWL